MYYIIQTEDFQPSDYEKSTDRVYISNQPLIDGSTRAVVIWGSATPENNRGYYAHGEYETLEEAKEAIEEIFGDELCEDEDADLDYITIIVYKKSLEEMTLEGSIAFLQAGIDEDITAETTDREIEELVKQWEKIVNDEIESTIHHKFEREMQKYRDRLNDE